MDYTGKLSTMSQELSVLIGQEQQARKSAEEAIEKAKSILESVDSHLIEFAKMQGINLESLINANFDEMKTSQDALESFKVNLTNAIEKVFTAVEPYLTD